jgi:hypothetical protein
MRYLIVAAALAAASSCFADSIARQGSDWVRLSPKPCADETVKAVIVQKGGNPEAFRAATAHLQGQDFSACWVPVGGAVGLVYSDGDQGLVSMADLHPVPEA